MTARVLKRKKGPVASIDFANPTLANAQSVFSSLFKTAGVKEGNWQGLAFYLAVAGGFVELELPPEKVGRKQKWTQADQIVLWAQAEEIRSQKPKPTLAEAFTRLRHRKQWQGYGALGDNYQEGRKWSPAHILLKVRAVSTSSFESAIRSLSRVNRADPEAALVLIALICLAAAQESGIAPPNKE